MNTDRQLSSYNSDTRSGQIYSSVNGDELVELHDLAFEQFHRIGQAFRKAERIAAEDALTRARSRVDRELMTMWEQQP